MIPRPVLHRLIELACLAPSVHNTQPWAWRTKDDRVLLYGDDDRLLQEEDPLGRNLVISCGAALDHLRVAARALGLAAEVVRLPQGVESSLLAEVLLSPGQRSDTAAEDIALLRERCTDRRRFTSWPVPGELLDELSAQARPHGVHALSVTDPGTRFRLELLSERAHLLRAVDPGPTAEQRRWVGRHGSDGVPVAVLPADPGPASARFAPGVVVEGRALLDGGDGVIVLGAVSDDPMAWLRTGEALSALWLHATRHGLSTVPMSLPIEVSSVRDELRDAVLGGAFQPHILVRIGWQAIGRSELPRTPRRPLADVLVG
ncbi:hypothetical protein [Nocardioides sp. MH1]|uniref:Acg family FMN-binding oxidoreductase n=1 Tax=Nocardioides sp. MH1 TaxID=3242490 RepID=UPI00351F93BD